MAEDEYFDLGSYRRSVSASNDEAKLWFNRGLVWSYGFNHEEAVKCFELALTHDADCAMAHWGVAYALGPNYNKPWDFFDPEELGTTVQRTHRAVETAKSLLGRCSPVEQALVGALEFRYPQDHAPADCAVWNESYADAMRQAYSRHPDDLDVAVLYADALMNLTPWQLWDLKTGEPAAGARTTEIKAVLDAALAAPGGPAHPGLLHLYIHLMEMSPTPEAALPAADGLRSLVPDAGHLNHMPTHIDVLLGDYARAMSSNQQAMLADERFLARRGPLNFYTLYRAHDYHFCVYAALFAGQLATALDAAGRLEASLSPDLLRVASPPMADWLEGFLPLRVHVLVRFGRWEDLLALPPPADPALLCVTAATVRYGRGVALAATGRVREARRERELFAEALRAVPDSRMLFNNKCADVLRVAEAMLDGELAYRAGDVEAGFAHLREAVARDDGLPYDEPWGWMQPTRHAYAALLTEQGRYEEAATALAEDLGLQGRLPRALRHPDNVWALHGYHECLLKLGRADEAATIEPRLRRALELADVPITASCFCRRGVQESTKI